MTVAFSFICIETAKYKAVPTGGAVYQQKYRVCVAAYFFYVPYRENSLNVKERCGVNRINIIYLWGRIIQREISLISRLFFCFEWQPIQTKNTSEKADI